MVVLEAGPDHFPDQDHVQEAWIVDGTGGLEEEAATIEEPTTNLGSDSVIAGVVDVGATEISEIIVIVTIVDAEGTEDGWEMVAAVVVVVPVVVVSEVVNEDVREAVLMTARIVNAVRSIVTEVPLTTKRAGTTGKTHRQQVLMLRRIGTKLPIRMYHKIHGEEVGKMRVWRKLKRSSRKVRRRKRRT